MLDTHYVVWAAVEQAKLSTRERALLEDGSITLFCSVVSLWELRLKWSRFDGTGRRRGPADPTMVRRLVDQAGWTMLPLAAEHAVTALDVRLEHSDPFDELLLVQAQVDGLRLLTRDRMLRSHPLAYLV